MDSSLFRLFQKNKNKQTKTTNYSGVFPQALYCAYILKTHYVFVSQKHFSLGQIRLRSLCQRVATYLVHGKPWVQRTRRVPKHNSTPTQRHALTRLPQQTATRGPNTNCLSFSLLLKQTNSAFQKKNCFPKNNANV